MRLFVAVDLPSMVADLVRDVDRRALNSLRWTTPEQWHVTLCFLGEVEDGELPALRNALDGVDTAMGDEVQAVLGPSSAWFRGRRVLQVPVAGLDELAAAVRAATAPWGEPLEHAFRGHLTLARVRGPKPGPAGLAGAVLSATWRVPEIVLYSSVRGAGGSRYEALHRVALPG